MILVTGGTGLVGSHLLVKLLQNNEPVKAIYRNKESLKAVQHVFEYYDALLLFDAIEWIKADITDVPSLELAFENVTKVYHCAAFISFDEKDKDKLYKVNIEGTANVVNCCIDFSVQKLCYVSSVAALGDASENELTITEKTEWNPEILHHDYAISKYAGEMEVWRGYQEGLQVVIVNPGVIFGYGFPDKGSSAVIQSLKKGNPFYTKGNFGMVTVDDVVAIMHQLMTSEISGERFTLVAENKSFQEVLNLIAGILKVKKPSIYANKVFTSFAWRLDWFLSKLLKKERKLTQASARAAHNTKTFDTTKVKNTLHYTFLDMTSYLKNLVPKI